MGRVILSLELIIFFGLVVIEGIRYTKFNENYIDRSTTSQINGIFVFIIIIKHLKEYVKLKASSNLFFFFVNDFLLQLVVVTFFFYSGYGIMESINKKGTNYVSKIPKKCLGLLWKFDIIIILYLILQTFLGNTYTLDRLMQSFLGWSAIGNSNWYFFIIVIMYLLTYISFKCFKDDKKKSVLLNLILSIILIFIMIALKGGQRRWYDTFICYNIGMLYSCIKPQFESFIKSSNLKYTILLVLSMLSFLIFKYFRSHLICYHFHGILFCFIVVLLSMKLKFNSKVLSFLGNHVFSIYMLQRLVMILLSFFGLSTHVTTFTVLVTVLSIVIAWLFDFGFSSVQNYSYN